MNIIKDFEPRGLSKINQIKLGVDYDTVKYYIDVATNKINYLNKIIGKYYFYLNSKDIKEFEEEKRKTEKFLAKNIKDLDNLEKELLKTPDFYEVHTTGWADSKKQILKKVIYMGNEFIFKKNTYVEENIDEDGYTELYLKPLDMLVYGESPSKAYQYLAEEINYTYFLLFFSEYKDKLSKGSLDIKKYFKENIRFGGGMK